MESIPRAIDIPSAIVALPDLPSEPSEQPALPVTSPDVQDTPDYVSTAAGPTLPRPPEPASLAPKQAQTTDSSGLTQEDIQAFKAEKFTLGKIPETPPPASFCTASFQRF